MFLEDDICWCGNSNECDYIDCFRHTFNMRRDPSKKTIFTSSFLKGTKYCPNFKKEKGIEE